MPEKPEKIGKYEISEQIGAGGFGAVYRGRDPFIKRTVAIKTCQLNDEEIKSRFFREAELAGNLHHRNITTIYDFGVENGVPYIVQEFLTGEDLDKMIKRGEKLSVLRKVEILIAITEGLGYAHKESIIHRDIKPSNIRILEDGTVKIMDFGIAKSLQSQSSLTQTGITLGTSAYLAPEQIRGEPLDQRTDIFTLGILAYELLTYRKPFRGEHLSTVLYKILNEAPDPIQMAAPDVPASLSRVISRAIEKNVEYRYPSMEALRQDLLAVYRDLVGSSSRFATTPRLSEVVRSAAAAAPPDSDRTIKTPTKGMATANITPPSGALARVPAPEDHTPTVVSTRRPVSAGLEVVNFRDPSQQLADRSVSERESRPGPEPRAGAVWIGTGVAALIAIGAIFILLSRSRPAPEAVRPAVSPVPVPTAPMVFPPPQLGQEPGGPAAQTTPLPAPRGESETVAPKPEPTRVPRRFKIQFSSIPVATLFVDGKKIGPSIPARSVELAQGNHTVRFEHPELAPHEKVFRVGPNGGPPIAYRFPVGALVIHAPAWTGANILIDGKFKAVLVGEKSFQLKSGPHKVTLAREGVAPYVADVTVPEGDKTALTPPPPRSHAESIP